MRVVLGAVSRWLGEWLLRESVVSKSEVDKGEREGGRLALPRAQQTEDDSIATQSETGFHYSYQL